MADRSHIGSKNAKDRVKQYPNVSYKDSSFLFCKICEKLINYECESIIKAHLKSLKHETLKQKCEADKAANGTNVLPGKRKSTIIFAAKSAQSAKDLKNNEADDFTMVFISANIPFGESRQPGALQFL